VPLYLYADSAHPALPGIIIIPNDQATIALTAPLSRKSKGFQA